MNQDNSFFKELISPDEIDCEYTEENSNIDYVGITLFIDSAIETIEDEHKKVLHNLLQSIDIDSEKVLILPFSLPAFREAIIQDQTSYIFCFGAFEELKHLHVNITLKSWIEVNDTSIFITERISDFAQNKQDKVILWKALQQKFKV